MLRVILTPKEMLLSSPTPSSSIYSSFSKNQISHTLNPLKSVIFIFLSVSLPLFSIILPVSSAFIVPSYCFVPTHITHKKSCIIYGGDGFRRTPLPYTTSSPYSLRIGCSGDTGFESEKNGTIASMVSKKEDKSIPIMLPNKFNNNQFQIFITNNIFLGIKPSVEIIAIMVIYFVEGALGIAQLAQTFYLKDTLKLGPAELSALSGIFALPWTIKPLYGLLTDAFPLFGYKRRSYLVACGCIGCLSYLSIGEGAVSILNGFVDDGEVGSDVLLRFTIASFVIGSACIAFSDVVADGIVVQRTRDAVDAVGTDEDDGTASAVAGGLQSLCWGSASVGGLISSYYSGSLLKVMGPEEIFRLTAILPLAIALTALFINELPTAANVVSVVVGVDHVGDNNKTGTENGVRSADESTVLSQLASLRNALFLPTVWKPMLFLFLWCATPTSEGAFFFFMTDELHIGPEILGRVNLVTSVASLFGVWGYQKYLRTTPTKDILFWTTIASAPLGLLQLLVVTHTNRLLGIPDVAFICGDDVVLTVLGEFALIPTLVLAARICPPGVEAVLFACLMSIFNFAGILGTEIGAFLTKFLGISGGEGANGFDNLGLLIILCNVSSLLPLACIGLLDDTSTSNDD